MSTFVFYYKVTIMILYLWLKIMKNGKGGSQNLTFGILINFPLFPKCKNFFFPLHCQISMKLCIWKHLMQYLPSSKCSIAGSFSLPTPTFSPFLLSLPFCSQIRRQVDCSSLGQVLRLVKFDFHSPFCAFFLFFPFESPPSFWLK